MTENTPNSTPAERQLQADQLLEEGIKQYYASNFEAALSLYQQAHDIYQEIGDKHNVWCSLNNIGLVYYSLGQDEQALKFLQQALEICREVSWLIDQADILDNIGWVYEQVSRQFKSEAKDTRDRFEGYIEAATSDVPIIKRPRKP